LESLPESRRAFSFSRETIVANKSANALLIRKAIEAFENKLKDKNVSVGDLVRLLELEKEMDADEPRDIKVTWVEPGEKEPNEK
jgi:hypothetical protein